MAFKFPKLESFLSGLFPGLLAIRERERGRGNTRGRRKEREREEEGEKGEDNVGGVSRRI